jgi:hypothetical protein
MDADTLSDLLRSINKWESIIAGTGQDDAGLNCALCKRYFELRIFVGDVQSPPVQDRAYVSAPHMKIGRPITTGSTVAETTIAPSPSYAASVAGLQRHNSNSCGNCCREDTEERDAQPHCGTFAGGQSVVWT